MVVVKNSIRKSLKVTVGSMAGIALFFFLFIKGTNHVEYSILIALVVMAFYGFMSLVSILDRRDKIIIDEVGILLPGKFKEYFPWEEILFMSFYESFGLHELSIYSAKIKQKSFFFFPLDVDPKDFSEFLNKRLDEMHYRPESALEEQTEKDVAAALDSPESGIQSRKPQNSNEDLSVESLDESEDSDLLLAAAVDKAKDHVDDDNDKDNSILPLWFSEFPVINNALFGGFFTSVICFILLLVANFDNPGPRTTPLGTGLVYVGLSFFFGTVFWPIFFAWHDFKDESFYGRKPKDPGPLKRQKEKKPVVMQMKKRSRK